MADRRAMRSSSRRTTPAPPLPPQAPTPQTARTTRRRGTRSASRDIEAPVEPVKPTRRSARQASIDSTLSESGREGRNAPKTMRKALKAGVEATDLTIVEEEDTRVAIQDAPGTPPRPGLDITMPRRSLGAVSEMSGTTAISSFTVVEAELLEPRFLLRHLPKLQQDVAEFLEHLVPEHGSKQDDLQHIDEMQQPDSDFVDDYNDYDKQLSVRLAHYRGEAQQYIRIRAVHAALFGSNGDAAAAQTGLDLILFQANLVILAKDLIHSDRDNEDMSSRLRELDDSFPTLFLSALILGIDAAQSPAGDSALLQQTFQLALELRTQLAIVLLEQASGDYGFDPNDILDQVFLYPDSTGEMSPSGLIRGWGTFALGGEDSALPQAFAKQVVDRMNNIRAHFPSVEDSQERGESVDLDGLEETFPWRAVILRLLSWVRARNKELQAAIQQQGGVSNILVRVKTEIEQPSTIPERTQTTSRASPRKKRPSFRHNGRRSSGKFDPNAEVDDEVLKKLIARERAAAAPPPKTGHQREPQAEEDAPEVSLGLADEEEHWQLPPDDEQDRVMETVYEAADSVEDNFAYNAVDDVIPTSAERVPKSSRPPQSTSGFVSLLKETCKTDKENRVRSLFERQATAQRVEFGDPLDDSQPTPGPSSKGKEPQRSNHRKRRHEVIDLSDDEDEDAFEPGQRHANVRERRAEAKRVRTDPSSSGAPTSHQPFRPRGDATPQPAENEEPSEPEAPDMTELAPPRSTLEAQKALARANTILMASRKARRKRTEWDQEEEEAFVRYMADYPKQYAKILAVDKAGDRIFYDGSGDSLVPRRTQVDLKDKARTLAQVWVKSRAGIRPGFEDIITPALAARLREQGFEW